MVPAATKANITSSAGFVMKLLNINNMETVQLCDEYVN